MGYAILRHSKIKGSGKGVCVAHNRRLAGEQKDNIDASLTPLNQYLGDAGVVGRINDKLPGKRRKDAVEAVELLLTASPEFFDSIEKDRRKLAVHPTFKKWVKATVSWAQKELGGNVVDVALHMDENSPHMHVLFVPMVEGRLCAKEVTSRAEMVRRQTSYAEVMGQFGLKRGDSAAETHRKHVPLKGKPSEAGGKALQERIASLEKSLSELTSRSAFLEGRRQAAAVEVTALMAERDALAKERDGLTADLKEMDEKLGKATSRDHELVAEITALRAEKPTVQPSLEQLKAIDRVLIDQAAERLEKERSALLEQFKPTREANPNDLRSGKVVGAVEGLAVLSVGRGVHVSHKLAAGQVAIKGQELNQQQRDGLAR